MLFVTRGIKVSLTKLILLAKVEKKNASPISPAAAVMRSPQSTIGTGQNKRQ